MIKIKVHKVKPSGHALTDSFDSIPVQVEEQIRKGPELVLGPQPKGVINEILAIAWSHVALALVHVLQKSPDLLRLLADAPPRMQLGPAIGTD